MKHKTCIKVLVAALAMTGCLKVQKKSEVAAKQAQAKTRQAQTPPKPVNNRALRLDDVFVEFVGQQPNMYNLIFSWPETRDRVRISMNGQQIFSVNTSERPSEGIANLQAGKRVSVLIEILDQEYHIITSETRELDVPVDYIFPKNFRLVSPMKIQAERVFMNESLILIENHDLEIRAQKLIILKKSFIQAYLTDSKAKVGVAGRNGGSVLIHAESAEGDLDITMNSEAGGDGLKGYQTPPCPHHAGLGCTIGSIHCPQGSLGFPAGSNGHLTVVVKHAKDFNFYPQEQISLGGLKGPRMEEATAPDYPVVSSQFINRSSYTCAPVRDAPARGADATPGKICLAMSGILTEQDCK